MRPVVRVLLGTIVMVLVVAGILLTQATPTAPPSSTTPPTPSPTIAPDARYVDPDGSDANPGTMDAPWRTLLRGLTGIRAGQTLYLRGGEYHEDFDSPIPKGTPTKRITVASYPGEHATIAGLIRLDSPDYWTIRDLTFTWGGGTFDDHMVKVEGGTGWILDSLDIYGSKSRAGLLIAESSTGQSPHDWVLRNSQIHDTKASNLYVNPGLGATNGLIERNYFWNSPTENVKIGWGGPDVASHLHDYGAANIVVRYNTLRDADQPLTIAEPTGGTIEAYRNLVVGGQRGFLLRLDGTQGYLKGDIRVFDNLGAQAERWCEDFGAKPGCIVVSFDNTFGSTGARGFGANADVSTGSAAGEAGQGNQGGLPAVALDPTERVLALGTVGTVALVVITGYAWRRWLRARRRSGNA